jgi:peptide/nickel transport system permease protein
VSTKGKRLSVAGILVAMLAAAAMTGDFLSVNSPTDLNLTRFFAPPARVHFVDSLGRFHGRPFVCAYELVDPLEVRYAENLEITYPLLFFGRGYTYRLFGLITTNRHLIGTVTPQVFYPLGTDELGRDVLSRVLAGARTSLMVVLVGICFYAALGLLVGTAAGFAGGWLDAVLMRTSEFFMAVPALYVIIALRALVPLKMPYPQTLLLVAGTLAAVTWPPIARGVRGLVLQLRGAPYVEAARALGCPNLQILCRHMLPAMVPFVVTQTVTAAPVFLLGEAVLSFLDIGFRDAGESWGSMLRSLRDARVLTGFWWNLAPLALIFVTLLCLTIIGNRLRLRDTESQVFRA